MIPPWQFGTTDDVNNNWMAAQQAAILHGERLRQRVGQQRRGVVIQLDSYAIR